MDLFYHSQGFLSNRVQIYLWDESSIAKSYSHFNSTTVSDVPVTPTTETVLPEALDDRVIPFSVAVGFFLLCRHRAVVRAFHE